ncbi:MULTISPECIES: MFS transporter [Streptomyces]|uniref:MFS transporter n=1 Tax=Streptomyces TaxID=1883 RepID=UPI002257016B|nr:MULTISPECIES: MFS transporter [unclassified Streptomyces]MCX4870108.1 MFS transporter [Streptomyces sp. NBC_00906]MCX4901271.1 MFS transporter [Streptomyces sp. NBC_00892]WTH87904.1 MFS transporter [Streptomyces sp. NBC_00825]
MRRDSLWFHQDFRQLWAGQTVSQFGTYVGQTVLPLLAATTLKASPFQMGVLTAAGTAAFLLIGLPTGVLVDRIRRRPVMLTADFARAALLFTVPLAAWVGVLTLAQLITVAFLVSVATVLFDVAYQSYLPSLVGRVQLMEGNTRLQSSLSAAEVMGPGVGGGLAQLIGAATSALTTAVSYLASGLLLLRIRTPEPRLVRHDGTRVRTQTKEGLAFVLGEKSLRAITISTALSNWAITILLSMQMLFLTRDLGLAPGAVGAVLALSGAGGLLGALTAGRCAQWIGPARAIWLIPLVVSPVALVVPIAEPGRLTVLCVLGLALRAYGTTVFNVVNVSYRQAICPDRLLGRVNATVRFITWGAMPVGGLLGGVLGGWIGVRATLWVSCSALALTPLPLLLSPLRSLREFPAIQEE